MRILILTQDDPFFLAKNIRFLLNKLPKGAEVVGTVLFDVSPFGKRESLKDKMKKTYDIFGFSFFVYYGIKYVLAKLNPLHSVAKTMKEFNIPIIQLEGNVNSPKNLEIIQSYKPDLLVSIGGNQIFRRPLLDSATHGCINLHTAPLPKYRGLMPSFWVMRFNETHTGVSVFFVDEGIDSGPILVQKIVEIGDRSQEELIKYTKQIGMESIIECIEKIQSGQYELIPNNEEEMTYYSFPTKEDVRAFKANGKRFY
ncbi:formyl transferase [Marinilongibacter aquaticus]|uniref:methionyl-tRNA formyltransferase n=1 Tax=Marinilongibacter aquaticus TaxID=2975157 RepID=UPI0021BD07FA|nr:formyltransferase family protein [Marinilongibacter aquaticus]UBM57896.1 formyl transferase [Marinilongibacter aquaticus]